MDNKIRYLVAIISVIGMSILPRAKFIQSLITNLVMLCTAAAISLLVGYSSTQARLHTSVITPQSAREYNSSASVVCAVWLFFQVYAANAARAKYPQLQLPVILYSIFSVVTCINMPRFPTMPTVKSFVERLLEAFLAGLACATVVSLLVLPVTVRQVVSKQMNGYVGLLQKCLTSHQAYLRSLEDPQTLEKVMVSEHAADYKPSAEINALNATVSALAGLHSKLQGDLPFAKREVAFGKLGPTKLGGIATHLRRVMLPTIGLFTMNELLERAAHFHGWNEKHLNEGLTDNEEMERKTVIRDWNDNLRSLRTSFDPLVSITCQGLEHAALQLELRKRPKSSSSDRDDVEAGAQNVRAGDPEFSKQLEQAIQAHHDGKREMLRDWCSRHGIDFSPGPEVLEDPRTTVSSLLNEHLETSETKQQQDRRQLYMLLYMDFLLWSVSKAVLALVKYSDELVADGTMSKNGIILPGWRRLKKWALTFLNAQEGPTEEPRGELGDFDQAAAFVDLGSAFNQRKDPEHLPPRNAIEKIGNAVRLIPRALRSSASLFGFRVAVATMSVSIVGFLADTQQWFVVHRVLWAIIMVKIVLRPYTRELIIVQ